MRRLVLLAAVVLAVLVTVPAHAAAAPKACGSVGYAKGKTTRVSAVKRATCPTARRVLKTLFNASSDDERISFEVTPGDDDMATDISMVVSVGNTWAWICPVYRDSKAVRGVTCTQRKRGRKVRAAASVPRRLWKDYIEDVESGEGEGEGA